MTNILLEGYHIDSPWIYKELKAYIKPHHKVAVLALSFRESKVKNLADWNGLYGKESGKFYGGIVGALRAYGICEENIEFVNYFADTKETARKKAENADIIYFTGGLPDKMAERIKELALDDILKNHKGIVMGYSAGALIQLAEYHITPDHDYPKFAYYKGLSYLNGFYLEVHYQGSDVQNESIRKVLAERGKNVFATHLHKGAIVVCDGKPRPIGKVSIFHG